MVGVALCPVHKLTANVMSGLVLFARYISAPMTLRYENSGPNTSSPSSHGLNGSVFISKVRTIILVLPR
jgi:hypothetical protein